VTLVARHGALTDIGLHRRTNEDTFVVRPPLYAVCDGMGGANAGEVASGLAAETLAAEVAAGRPLLAAAEAANAAVYRRAKDNLEQTGMGTTLTAFVIDGDAARFVHIGDSRAYLLRDGALAQVSDDHSLVGEMVRDGRLTEEEAAAHPHRSILSRALGTESAAQIDEFVVDLLPGDVLLLCSDGLSGPVSGDAMVLALTRSDPQAAAERLVKEARKHGGPDNITAVVVRVERAAPADAGGPEDEAGADTAELTPLAADEDTGPDAVGPPAAGDESAAAGTAVAPAGGAPDVARAARRRAARRLGVLAGLLALLAAAGAAGAVVLSTVFYIGVDNGRLAVYSGVPAQIGPIHLHAVYRRSVISYDSLNAAERGLVDEQALRDKADVLDVSDQLRMWP
jgi:serine/threonine protein phosphatase PrpC